MTMDAVSDSDFQLAKIRFRKLYLKAKDLDISDSDIGKLSFVKKYKPEKLNVVTKILKWIFFFLLAIGIFGIAIYFAMIKGLISEKLLAEYSTIFTDIDLRSDTCVIPLTDTVLDFFRPPVDCGFCEDVTKFDRVQNLSPEEFVKKYAYSGRPVIITDAMTNWTASQHFNFDFFRKLYKKDSPVFSSSNKECQFFPYKTKFQGLLDVFKMPKKMVDMQGDQWYIGWYV